MIADCGEGRGGRRWGDIAWSAGVRGCGVADPGPQSNPPWLQDRAGLRVDPPGVGT